MRTTRRLPLITSLICALMVLVLILSIGITFNAKQADSASAAAVYVSSFNSGDGYLYDLSISQIQTGSTVAAKIQEERDGYYVLGSDGRYHMTTLGASYKYMGSTYTKTYITNATELKSFIDLCSSSTYTYHVGILTSDIDYNMQTLGISSSTAAFFGILDCNAYTITITAPLGGSVLSYNGSYSNTAGNMSADGSYNGYQYAGMLCAVNLGTILNANIIWNSDYSAASTLTESNLALESPAGYEATSVAGIVCGLLYGGTIFNCNLTVSNTGAFAICHSASNSNTGMRNNSAIVGGYVGVMADNSRLERVTINNYGGITAAAEGTSSGTTTKKSWTVCGGLVGTITKTTAIVKNCSLTGNGSVNARMEHSPKNRSYHGAYGFAGGAIGGTLYISDKNNYTSFDIQPGQIDGIISAWNGSRTNDWWEKDTDVNNRNIKVIPGCLFDYIGSSVTIDNTVILYDYLSFVANNTSPGAEVYTTLDSGRMLGYGNWTEIYATNQGGNVLFEYDYSKEVDPIRVEVVADGFFDGGHYIGEGTIDDVVGASKNFFLSDTTDKLGKFIWSCEYNEDNYGEYSGTNIWTSEEVGAQIFLLSAARKGAIKYTFGEVVSLSYKNNNNAGNTVNFVSNYSKNYSGDPINSPTIALTRSNSETATVYEDAYAYDITYTIMDGFNETDYKYPVTDTSRTYLPGLYTYLAKKTVTENGTNFNYCYYSESSKVLANYDEANRYQYEILSDSEGLFVAECNSTSTNYLTSDTISIGYKNDGTYTANVVDYYSYAIGSATQGDLIAMGSNITSSVAVNTTGKYVYTFVAYLDNPYELEKEEAARNANVLYLQVGTATVQAFIDNEAPIIKNVHYYEYQEAVPVSELLELSSFDLDDWQTKNVLITYTVTDNNLSGLASGSGHTSKTEVGTTWDCQLLLDGTTSSQKVIYVDAVGNRTEQTFTLKIDTTQTQLDNVITLNYQTYLGYYAELGYCPVEVYINFKPIFGASGAYLEYSYELDENGQEIWIRYDAELKANIPNQFVLDFDIDNSFLKMRLVSEQGVYETYYANGDGYVLNGADDVEEAKNWSVKIVIAYIGITLDNLFYNGQALSSLVFRDLFTKTYDAKDTIDLGLTVKVYKENGDDMDKTSIVYSETYAFEAPKIIETNLTVRAIYDSMAAGDRTLRLYVDSVGDSLNKYRVFFTDGTIYVDYLSLENCDSYYEGATKINKATLNVNLADYSDQLKSEYIYGEIIPTSITIKGVADEDVELNLITNAKQTYNEKGEITAHPSVGKYTVQGEFAIDTGSYILNLTSMELNIVKKDVSVKTQIDGNADYTTKISFNGLPHVLTGYYLDAFGVKQNVVVTYYKDSSCTGTPIDISTTGGVIETGEYFAKLTISDSNYAVYNTGSIISFTITKVFLELDLTEQTKQFANKNVIPYDIVTLGKYADNVYTLEDFDIIYYKVVNDIVDLENPLSSVSDVGRYLVDISFGGNSYFYDKKYGDTYLNITQAETTISADDISIKYDGEKHIYDVLLGNIHVESKEYKSTVIINGIYYDLTGSTVAEIPLMESGVFLLQYWDNETRTYVTIDLEHPGTQINTGSYRFRVVFTGDLNYKSVSKVVTLTITQASFEGIEFNDKKVNFEGEETYYDLFIDDSEGSALKAYLDKGARLVYRYQSEERDYSDAAFEPFKFNKVGTYTIDAVLSLDNYATTIYSAKLIIDKTAMSSGIKPVMQQEVIVYDGNFHPAEFTGFDADPATGKMIVEYVPGYEDQKVIQYVYYKGTKVTVSYDDNALPVDAGEYEGYITFTSDDYADMTIKTSWKISKKAVEVQLDTLQAYFNQITSSTNISALGGTFINVFETKDMCQFEYYDKATGKKIELDENGCLPAGEYRIVIVFNDGNYETSQVINNTLVVTEGTGAITKPGDTENATETPSIMDIIMDNILYIGIGVGVVVVIIIVAIAASASNKKKKKKKKSKVKSVQQTRQVKKTSSKDRATF